MSRAPLDPPRALLETWGPRQEIYGPAWSRDLRMRTAIRNIVVLGVNTLLDVQKTAKLDNRRTMPLVVLNGRPASVDLWRSRPGPTALRAAQNSARS